jgi:CcmD family protein
LVTSRFNDNFKEEKKMTYLFMAYSVIWTLIAGYVVVLGRRQKELKKELQLLEEWNSEK